MLVNYLAKAHVDSVPVSWFPFEQQRFPVLLLLLPYANTDNHFPKHVLSGATVESREQCWLLHGAHITAIFFNLLGFGCSRNSEDNTTKYPDVAAVVPKLVKAGIRGVVLDCEAVAFDRATNKILPFQVCSYSAHPE